MVVDASPVARRAWPCARRCPRHVPGCQSRSGTRHVSIVILSPNWLGDAMFALPAIRDVRRHFAGRPMTIAARPSIAPVFRAVPGIDHIKVLEPGKEATQIEADIGILFPNSFRSAWILKRAGVRERWGYGSDFRRLLLTRAVRRPKRRVAFPEYY